MVKDKMNNKDWEPIKPKRANALLEEYELRLAAEKERDQLNLYIDECKDNEIRWRKCAEELAKQLSRWYPTYGFCVDSAARTALEDFEKLKQKYE